MKQFLAIGILAFLLLSACVQVTPAQTKEVLFGFIGPLTGNIASIGAPTKDAVELAVQEINSANLIPGKTLKIIYEDDACDPKKSTNAMQKLVGVDKVSAVIGPFCSGPVLAAAPIAEENKVLIMSYSATNPKIRESGDYIFRNVPSDANQGVAGANIVKKRGAQKVAIIHIQNDWASALVDVFKAEASRLGMEVVAIEEYAPDDADFKTQLAKIKEAKPDALYMLSHPADAVLVLKQASEAGLKMPIVGADASKDDTIIAGAGADAEGLTVTLPAVANSSEFEKFAAAYKAKTGKENIAYAPEAYDVVYILAKACAATDCTSTAMKDYLYAMGSYTGASGTYEFDENGEVEKSYDYFQVKNGKFVKVQ